MINIFQNPKITKKTISNLLKTYSSYLEKILSTSKFIDSKISLENKLKKINLNIKDLAIVKFENLLSIESKFCRANAHSPLTENEKEYLMYLYGKLRQNFGFKIANTFFIRTCPYCNTNDIRIYFDIDKNRNIIEAQLDHFYPKAIHPLLTICFFNLIPICSNCNLNKSNNYLKYSPYVSDSSLYTDSLLQFSYTYDSKGELQVNLKILNDIICSNVKILKLRYKYNSNEAKEQVDKSIKYYTKYPEVKIESLKSLLLEDFPDDEVNKILFIIENKWNSGTLPETSYSEQNYSESSYSKLWHDIGKQINDKLN